MKTNRVTIRVRDPEYHPEKHNRKKRTLSRPVKTTFKAPNNVFACGVLP